jgi:uncharacterized protein (DUF433 family)
MDYRELIVRDPGVVGGQPVLKGTRVTLNTVLSSLAEGATIEQILNDFPTLNEDHVRAAIAFADASANDPGAAELRREIDIGVKQAEAGQLRSGADFFDELRQRLRRG